MENRIGINNTPYEFNKIYRGQYNGIRFFLIYNKLYEDDYGESEYTIEINFRDVLDEERKKIVNEAIIKIFKSKIEAGTILRD